MTLSFNPSNRFQHDKKKCFFVFFILFGLNVAFKNLSVISRRCLDVNWTPREESDQYGYSPSLISLRCAPNGLLRSYHFYLQTVKTDQTGQMRWLI